MRPLILASSFLFLVLTFSSNSKDPKYLKLLENCADVMSEPERRKEIKVYIELLNSLTGKESPDFKRQYKERIKTIENLLELPFSKKRTYLVYQPALFQCEKSWEKNPVAFKSRWE